MYIDVILLVVLLLLVVMFFKRFSSFVLALGIIETFLRIVSFIKNNIPVTDIAVILNKYIPDNIFAIKNIKIHIYTKMYFYFVNSIYFFSNFLTSSSIL